VILCVLTAWLAVGVTQTAAAPTVKLSAALPPEHLGQVAAINFSFSIHFAPSEELLPLTQVSLLYPAHLDILTSELGLETCNSARLNVLGPEGCPSNSVMGYGLGLTELRFGPQIVYEWEHVVVFMAPIQNGNLGLLLYSVGYSPVSAELVYPGIVLPASAPFGGELFSNMPLVPSLPEAPDAALVKFSTSLGSSKVTYYSYKHGKRVAYHPRGVRLPRTCPAGGFRFAIRFVYLGGTRGSGETAVPCPRVEHRRH
jgi:hypothetical protein